MIWHALVLYGLSVLIARTIRVTIPGIFLFPNFNSKNSVTKFATGDFATVPGSWIETKPISVHDFVNVDNQRGCKTVIPPKFRNISSPLCSIKPGTTTCTTQEAVEIEVLPPNDNTKLNCEVFFGNVENKRECQRNEVQNEASFDGSNSYQARTQDETNFSEEIIDALAPILDIHTPVLPAETLDDGWEIQRRKRRRSRKHPGTRMWEKKDVTNDAQHSSNSQKVPVTLGKIVGKSNRSNPYEILFGLEEEENLRSEQQEEVESMTASTPLPNVSGISEMTRASTPEKEISLEDSKTKKVSMKKNRKRRHRSRKTLQVSKTISVLLPFRETTEAWRLASSQIRLSAPSRPKVEESEWQIQGRRRRHGSSNSRISDAVTPPAAKSLPAPNENNAIEPKNIFPEILVLYKTNKRSAITFKL